MMKDKITAVFGQFEDESRLKGCYIAGGAITSLYTNQPINDWDIYPKSQKALEDAVYHLFDDGYYCAHMTKRAITFARNETKVQIVCFDTFPSYKDIFDHYDFTICMGSFDLDSHKFHLHENFLLHCSQRFLSFNVNTKFPYDSADRVKKYVDRGYTIGKMEFFKILMACQRKRITNWDEMKEQMGGVYGEAIDIPEDGEFTFEKAIEAVSTMRPTTSRNPFGSPEEVLIHISKDPIPYYELPGNNYYGPKYSAKVGDRWTQVTNPPTNGIKVGIDQLFPGGVFYKKVKVGEGGVLQSIYHSKFKYAVGQQVSSPDPYIYCFPTFKEAAMYNCLKGSPGYKVIRLVAKTENIVYDGSQIRLKEAFVEAAYEPTATTIDVSIQLKVNDD